MVKQTSKPSDAVTAELEKFQKSKETNINLGDGASLKRALDDTSSAAVLTQGYKEDFTFSNLKIGIGLFTCSLAAIAQFWPAKYPDSFWVLLTCVGLYIVATLAMNIALGGIEGDIMFLSKPKAGRIICLASRLPRYSEQYTLTLGTKTTKWSRGMERSSSVVELNVTQYFDTEGNVMKHELTEAVVNLLMEFEKSSSKKAQ